MLNVTDTSTNLYICFVDDDDDKHDLHNARDIMLVYVDVNCTNHNRLSNGVYLLGFKFFSSDLFN